LHALAKASKVPLLLAGEFSHEGLSGWRWI
jgi:hypothetical protein